MAVAGTHSRDLDAGFHLTGGCSPAAARTKPSNSGTVVAESKRSRPICSWTRSGDTDGVMAVAFAAGRRWREQQERSRPTLRLWDVSPSGTRPRLPTIRASSRGLRPGQPDVGHQRRRRHHPAGTQRRAGTNRPAGPRAQIHAAAFSPDSRLLASAADRMVRCGSGRLPQRTTQLAALRWASSVIAGAPSYFADDADLNRGLVKGPAVALAATTARDSHGHGLGFSAALDSAGVSEFGTATSWRAA